MNRNRSSQIPDTNQDRTVRDTDEGSLKPLAIGRVASWSIIENTAITSRPTLTVVSSLQTELHMINLLTWTF